MLPPLLRTLPTPLLPGCDLDLQILQLFAKATMFQGALSLNPETGVS